MRYTMIFLQRAKRGQYQVLDDISKYIPGVDEGKAHIDHIINLCGEKPEGDLKFTVWTKKC